MGVWGIPLGSDGDLGDSAGFPVNVPGPPLGDLGDSAGESLDSPSMEGLAHRWGGIPIYGYIQKRKFPLFQRNPPGSQRRACQ